MEGFYKHGLFFDLLEARVFNEFVADPSRLSLRIPEGFADWVVIDEIQKVPALLDEVHRLIMITKSITGERGKEPRSISFSTENGGSRRLRLSIQHAQGVKTSRVSDNSKKTTPKRN